MQQLARHQYLATTRFAKQRRIHLYLSRYALGIQSLDQRLSREGIEHRHQGLPRQFGHGCGGRLTPELSGRCRENCQDTATYRSGPLERMVRAHGALCVGLFRIAKRLIWNIDAW